MLVAKYESKASAAQSLRARRFKKWFRPGQSMAQYAGLPLLFRLRKNYKNGDGKGQHPRETAIFVNQWLPFTGRAARRRLLAKSRSIPSLSEAPR